MALFLVLLVSLFRLQVVAAVSSLTIETSSGSVTGLINGTTPNVAQFLGIPYAEPPVGNRRWLPAVAKSNNGSIDATNFGLNCPQWESNSSSVYSIDARQFLIYPNSTGEDCLSVNVWAPWGNARNSSELLPVIAWIYGGGFQTGGGDIEYQIPARWIERSQKHIVVGINYRLNIFGFPNAAGLNSSEQNVGLLDQRLGLEWIRTNIANFGGDPARISLWGQSAGAASVDFYNLAYPTDPIVSGLIMDSGNALLPLASSDPTHTNFTFVANHFGCGTSSAAAELTCLRNVSSDAIVAFLKTYGDSGASPALEFAPVVDNRTVFSNATARALAGNFTKKPAIAGTNVHEGFSLVGPYNAATGPNATLANLTTLVTFLCPTVQTTKNRYAVGVPTFRYLYAGNFSNIAPQPWEGAYHSSELPLVFGTSGIARGASTPFEQQVSMKMQDYWLAFAKDPVNGLPGLGWEAYTPAGKAIEIGKDGVVVQGIAESALEAPCDGVSPKPGGVPPS